MTNFTTVLKEVCEAQGVTLVFADINQANFLVDQLVGIDFPALVVMPYKETDNVEDGTFKRHVEIEFEAFMVTQIEGAEVDKAKVVAQELGVEPMLTKARAFVTALNATAIIKKDNPEGGIGTRFYEPTYSEFDANLVGAVIRTTVPVIPSSQC